MIKRLFNKLRHFFFGYTEKERRLQQHQAYSLLLCEGNKDDIDIFNLKSQIEIKRFLEKEI